jgi:hypothetical protein
MFWVIFDTSTKRDYYRDVHNLLALPPGATLRYDYNEVHLSDAAKIEAQKGGDAAKAVLVAYAQDKKFVKNGPDPKGPIPIPFEQGLWVGTRIARLSHLRHLGNRYYFDLEMGDYPTNDGVSLQPIMEKLAAAEETPFRKWVAMSDIALDVDSLAKRSTSENWASVINVLGTIPSQFAGDSFWRVAGIASGPRRTPINSVLQPDLESVAGRDVTIAVQAAFPVSELDRLALQIESRMPEMEGEPSDKEPEKARTVTLATSTDGPLKDLNNRSIKLRRYATEWTESEVAGSDRVDAQLCELTATTGPQESDFPIGPEFRLRFQITKRLGRSYFAILLAVAAVVCGAFGADKIKDDPGSGILVILLGVFLALFAGFLWTGKVKLPGGKG